MMTDMPKLELVNISDAATQCIAEGYVANHNLDTPDAPVVDLAIDVVRYALSYGMQEGMTLAQSASIALADIYPHCINLF